jgi:serine/threonine protein kinase/tetratricopeptide (TPR) repeat protein
MNENRASSAPDSRYVLHERLGVGGQAEVWRAHDPDRGIDVALKILRPGAGRNADAWEALKHEYANASRLDHPFILKVFPPERDGSNFLLPMELATGGDLGRLRGASYLAVVPVLIEVAQALGHAHERGVIHRDLKASNVLFDGRGRVQLADFGVSGRAVDAGTDAMIRGLSPFSASPEQLRGEAPQPGDDIYALGALAYELLSNHPPYYPRFDARRVQSEPVPALVPTNQIPVKLDALIMRMLAKRASERPASMDEVIQGLEGALNDTLIFDAAPGTTLPPELVANHTIQLPSDAGVRAALSRNVTVQLDDLAGAMPSHAARAQRPAAPPTVHPVPESQAAAVVPEPSAQAAPAQTEEPLEYPQAAPAPPPPITVELARLPESPRARVPPMKPVWQRAALPAAPMRAMRWRGGRRNFEPSLAPAPATVGAIDGALIEELRDQPLRRPPLEPMKSGAPRVLLLLALLAVVIVSVVRLVPRYFDAATPAAALAGAEAMVDEATNSHLRPASVRPAPEAAGITSAVASMPAKAASPAAKTVDEDGYSRAVGEGYAALGAGRLEEARAAFERARSLSAENAEALEGLRRVGGQTQAQSFTGARAHAEDLESQERWQDAIEAYRGILRQDSTLTFAQAGKTRAEERLQLDESLQDVLEHPERLSSPSVREQASQLLQTASEQPSPGPVLSSQISRLALLLPGSNHVVHVSLISDSQAQVAIEGVGSFGSFSQRDVELKPGRYTITCTREGSPAVRQDITVAPGADNQTITVSCDESG